MAISLVFFNHVFTAENHWYDIFLGKDAKI